ncbi:MAG TPA: dioxygenase [Candidatus Acidoferrales bacterium]|nr:dioxygenase [Candidatus Acidoferrales bacterium]
MKTINENTITDVALQQMASTPNLRLRQIMDSLVRHLHAFAREVDLTPEEWLDGIRFLTAVGQKCTAHRQEFILLSDTLGMSALVNALHDKRAAGAATKSSLLGPFYRQDAPMKNLGDSIIYHTEGTEVVFYGRVIDSAGRGIPNALVRVWEPDETGHYDLQRMDPSVMDLRGCFRADSEGRYYFRGVCPTGYMIPMDGPVGDMIRAQKRHGYRPAHIHFVIGAPGYRELVTALYVSGDSHIDSDTVFGVDESLIISLNKVDRASPLPGLPSIHYDFRLAAAKGQMSGRVGADPSQITSRVAEKGA